MVELRGDEALAVFGSARQAIRAAVDLQDRFADETVTDPSFPLTVGIGIDAGEAVAIEGGYRGGALNLAARLCGQASAGEVLASQEATHLARKVEGVRYVDRGEVHLKGLSAPVRIIRVVTEGADPAIRLAPFAASRKAPSAQSRLPRFLSGRRGVVAIVVLVVLGGTLVPIALTRGRGAPGLPAIDANAVGLIDLGSGSIRRSISVGSGPSGIAFGLGAVWVANATDGTVSRVDPESGTAVQIPVGNDPTGIAVDPSARAVWVTNGTDGTVSRIDAATGNVLPIRVGNGPAGVAVGLGGVWVADSLDDTVSFIDRAKGTVQTSIPVGATPTGVAIAAGAVWVSNATDGTVSRIDPGSPPVVRSISVGQGPTGIASGSGAVWVANSLGGSVSRIDATKNDVTGLIPVGRGPGGVAVTAGRVWVSNEFTASVSEIDPGTNQVTKTIAVKNAPQALAAASSSLWVSARGAPTSHRGGTLTVAVTADTMPQSLDPTTAENTGAFLLTALTNDGLIAYQHVGGAAGSTVVPDLATSIPVPTDGGLTYTFQLRSGIRYSNGQPVKAEDVRRGIERMFALGAGGAPFLADIVGAGSCAIPKHACDLSKGIETYSSTGTVTFHLTHRDAEFLINLASQDVVVVPDGVPNRDMGARPLPATGPYMFGAFTPGQRVELVRNPKFHFWSPQAKPDGYPNQITWVVAPGSDGASQTARAVADVEEGNADVFGVALDSPTNEQLQEIRNRVPAQVHDYLDLGTFYFFLNTQLPPFNDVRVRQAINFAVNRNRALEAYYQQGRVTCQILPPNFLGYRPFCPYALDPNDAGTWDAPDISKATRMVAESGTGGQLIRMAEWAPFGPVATYVASVLRSLGYRVSLKLFSDFGAFYPYVADSRNRVHMAGFWSVSSSTSPAGWFSSALTCAARAFADPNNFNPGLYCNPKLDAQIAQATDVQLTDPAASAPLWAKVDQEMTLDAPWLSLFTQGGVDFVSKRVGNYQHNPVYGVLLDQLWVK